MTPNRLKAIQVGLFASGRFPPPRRLLRDALVIVGIVWFAIEWFVLGYHIDFLVDARAYWEIDLASPYHGALGAPGTFPYSPPVFAVFAALHNVPEPIFLAAWMGMNIAILAWLLRGRWLQGLMLAMPISAALLTGQIELLMVGALVARWPAASTVTILAKGSTGVVLIWFLVRGEWRSLLTVLTLLVTICLVSLALTPAWWAGWIAFLRRSAAGDPQFLIVRVIIAGGLIAWGAVTNHRWVLPVGAMLALPFIWMTSLAMLAAIGKANDGQHDATLSPQSASHRKRVLSG